MTPRRLCLLLVLTALPIPARAAESDKYLPNATEGVVTINVKPFLESPLFKDNLDGLKQVWKQLGFDQAISTCLGLDPFVDVERVQFALLPNGENEAPLVLLHGNFDAAKVQSSLDKSAKERKNHVQNFSHNGREFHRLRLDVDDAEKPLYVAPLGKGLVALSTEPNRIVEVLDKKDGKRKPELRKDVEGLLSRVDPRHAVSIASLSRPLSIGGLLGGAQNSFQNVTGGVVLGDDVKLELSLSARDVQNAKNAANQLTDQLNQAKAAVAVLVTQQKQFMPLAEFVNGVRVAAAGNEVTLKVTVSKELVDSIFKKE